MHIVVAGYGREGKQSVDYFLRRGHRVTVADEAPIDEASLPSGVAYEVGEGVFERLDNLSPDMVVRTAGLAPYKLKTTAKVWSATNEFFQNCPAVIIGVTGSKGKGTTCSLIASILRAAGKTVHLVGNIGVPALSQLDVISPHDVVVYELSSFQLWDCQYSPHIAVILHIEPDHLDVHPSFEDYLAAKARIVAFQTRRDVCLYHPTNLHSAEIAEVSPLFPDRAARYGTADTASSLVTAYDDGTLLLRSTGQPIGAVSLVQLPGAHNLQNAEAAISAVLALLPAVSNHAIATGLQQFTGLDHRLKLIATVNEVHYYDDSIATTPGSAMAATQSFQAPKVMLLGGSSKGADFSLLAQTLAAADMRQVLLFGAEAPRLAEALDMAGVTYQLCQGHSMTQLVAAAADVAQPGDVVILSPACASFDMFQSYEDRGQQFITAVQQLSGGGDHGSE